MEFGRPGSRISRAQSRMSTPLINAEGAEARIKNRIFRNWKEIQRSCRNCDKNNTGTIQIQELRGIIECRIVEKRYYVTHKIQRIYLGNNNQNFQIVWLNNWGEKLKVYLFV